MNTTTLNVLVRQLQQLRAQFDQLLASDSGPLWQAEGLTVADRATLHTRLDDARHAVNMACIRAVQAFDNAKPEPLPVCANDRPITITQPTDAQREKPDYFGDAEKIRQRERGGAA